MIATVGCGVERGPVAAPAAVIVVAEAPPEREDTADPARLAWVRDSSGAESSYWIGSNPLRRAAGIRLSDGRETWRFATDLVAVRTVDCDPVETGDDRPAAEGVATRAKLVGESGAEVVLVEPANGEGLHQLSHRVEILASVGPLVFLRVSSLLDGCGGHPNFDVELRVWNLAMRAPAPLPSDAERASITRTFGGRAEAEMARVLGDSLPPGPPSFFGILPRYGVRGTLSAEYLFWEAGCDACGTSEWGSYMSHVEVPAGQLPASFVPYEDPGPTLRKFLSDHPGLRLGGWTLTRSG